MTYSVRIDKNVSASEFSALMEPVGWGSDYPEETVRRSISAYPLIAHARSESGDLVSYISAFSDRAFSTMLGELVVHPAAYGKGVGRVLLTTIENEYPRVPVYVKPLGPAAKQFFLACGYRAPRVEIQVLFKGGASEG